jgi:hypothetical protein
MLNYLHNLNFNSKFIMSLRKRRKLDLETLEDSIPDIIGEIDLEIGFRERLARTLESRITWALILREALQSGVCSKTLLPSPQINWLKIGLDMKVPRRRSKTWPSTHFIQSKRLPSFFSCMRQVSLPRPHNKRIGDHVLPRSQKYPSETRVPLFSTSDLQTSSLSMTRTRSKHIC